MNLKSFKNRFAGRRASAGFTMIELIVVLAIIGGLIVILAPTLMGNRQATMATQIPRIADAFANNWQMLANEAGVSTQITANTTTYSANASANESNPILANAKTLENILIDGDTAAIATPGGSQAYVTAYNRSGVRALNGMVTWEPGASKYILAGTTDILVDVAGGGTNPLIVRFQNVPVEVSLLIVQKANPAITALTCDGTDKTVGQILYNCANGASVATVKYSRKIGT